MTESTLVLGQLFNGISVASILLLAALGLALSFGLMRVINMAHGEMLMLGGYLAYVSTSLFGKGAGFFIGLIVAFAGAALFGALLEVTLIRRLYGRPLDTLLATWGVSLILQQLARSIFGASNVAVTAPTWLSGALLLSPDVGLPYKRLFIIALVIACIIGIYFYMYRSSNGRRMRAVMQGREMAAALGVATRRVDAY